MAEPLTKQDVNLALENFELKLTMRLGNALAFGALAAILKLT